MRPGTAYKALVDAPSGLLEDWDGALTLLEYAAFERLHVGGGGGGGGGGAGAKGGGGSGTGAGAGAGTGAGAGAGSSSSSTFAPQQDLSSSPVLLVEPLYASKADKERWCEVLFETYKCPGVFMARAGVLALYANAKLSGITVDVGGGGASVLPVQDGYALLSGAKRVEAGARVLGGGGMDAALLRALHDAEARLASSSSFGGGRLRPTFPGVPAASVAALHPSVSAYHALLAARDVKEHVCSVLPEPILDAGALATLPNAEYALPDGSTLFVGAERHVVPELLFNPGLGAALGWTSASPFAAASGLGPGATAPVPGLAGAAGLPSAVVASAMACDPDARRDLMGQIVLTGGGSAMNGLYERLARELASASPPGTRARVVAAAPEERCVGPWVGGSILASLGTMPDLWFGAEEYKEHGAKMLHRKVI